LSARYHRLSSLDDLNRGIEAYEEALSEGSPQRYDRALLLGNLGASLDDRFQYTGNLDDLVEATGIFEQAVDLTPTTSTRRPARLLNLALVLRRQHGFSGKADVLDRAIDLTEEAIVGIDPDSPTMAFALNKLSNGLSERFERSGNLDDLARAIELSQAALSSVPSTSPAHPTYLNNAGTSLLSRYEVSGDRKDLTKGIELIQAAVRETPPDHPDSVGFSSNLASAFADLFRSTSDPRDQVRATEAFRRSCDQAGKAGSAQGIASALHWGAWASERGAWAEASEAYGFGGILMWRLSLSQLLRWEKEVWLGRSKRLPGLGAHAFAMADDPQGAVEAIEGGRALLLSEALERDRADLGRLVGAGRADLKERYEAAAGRWNQLSSRGDREISEPEVSGPPSLTGPSLTEELRVAKEELDATIEQIRAVPGYERFLLPPTFSDVVVDAGDDPLIYLGATEAGGLALIVRPTESSVEAVSLPELTEESLSEQVRAYRDAYDAYGDGPRTTEDRIPWESSIDQVTAWVWDTAMAPVLEALGKTPRMTLVPAGLLGVLPLHAAWIPDASTPTGRRYALDHLTPTYAPNARALAAARGMWEEVHGEHLVAVDEPDLGNDDPRLRLPLSSLEVGAATSIFPDHEVLAGPDATEPEVLEALARAQMFHLSCHGRADPARPLDSALTMAGGDPLSLGDILDRRLRARIGVLSACETAIPGQELPDEVVALPTGLIQAGVGAVVASLWSVPGLSTAMLMVRFYERWKVMGMEPADALREAQCWVRDTTTSEKTDYFETLLPESGNPMASAATEKLYRALAFDSDLDPESRDHEGPYHWAAFTYVGA
jgi:hypothetical protein